MDLFLPNFKFYEYDHETIGEVIKRIFKVAEIPYKHIRLPASEIENTTIRQYLPLGRLPALEFDGVIIVGVPTICRSLAARLGYNGRTSLEDAQVDMIGDLVFEAWEHLRHWLRETLPSEKVTENPQTLEIYAKNYFSSGIGPFLEDKLSWSSKFVVADRATWADFLLQHFLKRVVEVGSENFFHDYPNLLNYYKKYSLLSNPEIVENGVLEEEDRIIYPE